MILKCINCDSNLVENGTYFHCSDYDKCDMVCQLYKDGSIKIINLLYNNIYYDIKYNSSTNEISINNHYSDKKFTFKAHLDFKKEKIINLLENLIFM